MKILTRRVAIAALTRLLALENMQACRCLLLRVLLLSASQPLPFQCDFLEQFLQSRWMARLSVTHKFRHPCPKKC